jgi:nucleotide-binding universal stress UspA family protein
MNLPFKRILCSTDFSEPSYAGVEAAISLARLFDSELFIVHVVSPIPIVPGSFAPAGSYLPKILEELENSAKTSLQKLVQERIPVDLSPKTMVTTGTPAMEIVRSAVKIDADVIVIATHGQSGWKKFISGSVTERVVRLSDRPVLTIHAPGKEIEKED